MENNLNYLLSYKSFFYLLVLRSFFVAVLVPPRLLRIMVPPIVCCEFLGRFTSNDRDESDNANTYKSILGTSVGESSRSLALDLWTLIFVTVCLFVNKTILKPATSNISIRRPCRSIIFWSEALSIIGLCV